jgi:predicted Zn-dependent peptidase
LAFFETLLDWQEINEGPKKYEAVTAADIKRVANKYFSPANRSVAVYRRAAAESKSGFTSGATSAAPTK